MIALGYEDDSGRLLKRKNASEVCNLQDAAKGKQLNPFPAWFHQGVISALLAPTAVNQQKFYFRYIGKDENGVHRVKAERKFSLIGYTKMDLGIAKLHFELGAGKENFEWV